MFEKSQDCHLGKFEKMVHALGGPGSFLNTYDKILTNPSFVEDIILGKQGWIKEIKTRELGLILIELGGGRKQIEDKIDYHVGYDNIAEIGTTIDASTPVMKVFTKSQDDFNKVKKQIENCFVLSDSDVSKMTAIYQTVN